MEVLSNFGEEKAVSLKTNFGKKLSTSFQHRSSRFVIGASFISTCKMTSRLTCLLIFTLLLASHENVFADTSTAGPPPPGPAPATKPDHECPDGEYPNADCGKGVTCSTVCYRDMWYQGENKARCCANLGKFCSTGLHVKHSASKQDGQEYYLYKFLHSLPLELWYKIDKPKSTDDGVSCPLPNSFALKVDKESYLPAGWKEKQEAKACKDNKECEEGEFCDAVWNPSYERNANDLAALDKSGANGKSLRFCYKLPEIESNMKHVEHDNGLKLCNIHKDCNDTAQICHVVDKKTFLDESNPDKPANGICVHVDACIGREQLRGTLNVNSQLCTDDTSCQDAGISKGNQDYNPHCTSYFPADKSRKVCCFEKNPTCRIGKTVTPYKNCTKMSDCTGDVLVKDAQWNTWCDDAGLNMCCKDSANKQWQCPDLITPLFNEPKCTGSTAQNIHSGKCPKKGGRCVHGHCCPPLTISENGTKVDLGRNLYETEFPCNPDSPIPTGFSYVFCNSETKKLIVVGKFHNNGDSMTKVSGSKCTINSDCSKDGSAVCVYENDKNHLCYYNPLRALRPEVSSFWKTMLIVSLICAGVFLITSLVCFVCYRSKSVFDKYKPKKKKGKKGKGSDSKSSKGSKGGKNKKKGGKKGKKGEESSSSKKSKTNSKKDTEKSEAGTTGDGTTSSQIN